MTSFSSTVDGDGSGARISPRGSSRSPRNATSPRRPRPFATPLLAFAVYFRSVSLSLSLARDSRSNIILENRVSTSPRRPARTSPRGSETPSPLLLLVSRFETLDSIAVSPINPRASLSFPSQKGIANRRRNGASHVRRDDGRLVVRENAIAAVDALMICNARADTLGRHGDRDDRDDARPTSTRVRRRRWRRRQ